MLKLRRPGGLRFRLMAAFGIFTLAVIAASLIPVSYVVPFTEQHLVAENQYYTLKGMIDYDIAEGRNPRLIPIKRLYASRTEVNGVRLDPIPKAYRNVPEGYSEYETPQKASFLYRIDSGGVTYILETDQTEFEEIEQRLNVVIYVFAGIMLLLSLLLAWALARTVTRPLRELAREVRRCAESPDFRPLSVRTDNDEVGYLARVCESSLKRLHETLERERLFASDLSHELRTDLAVVSTTAELLEGTGGLAPRQSAQMQKISRAAAHMQLVTRALLSLVRTKGIQSAEADAVPLTRAARKVLERERSGLHGGRVRLELRDGTTSGGPLAPEGMVTLVLDNLVRNAVRYTDEGAVTVDLTDRGFRVTDDGHGIAEDELDKIFEPHYRGRGCRGAGMGIGLSIVSRICEREGWIVSAGRAPGRGACFSVLMRPGDKAPEEGRKESS